MVLNFVKCKMSNVTCYILHLTCNILLLHLTCCILLCGCSDDATSTFSNREHVYCYFDALQYPELFHAMGNLGQYATIRKHVVNGVTKITMTSASSTTDYTVTPTPATSELYVALPDISSKTLTLTATDGTYHYAYEKSGVTFANGQYYEITVKMSKTAPVAAAAVDLGLSVKWANMNVGAESVTDRGLYFAWGETTGHAFGSGYKFSLDNYAWYNSTDLYTKYKHDGSSWDYEELASDDDAATRNWGGMWRMPTKAEWEELLNEDNCTWTWTTDYKGDGSNVAGVIVTSKKVGYTDKSIFLPATGIVVTITQAPKYGPTIGRKAYIPITPVQTMRQITNMIVHGNLKSYTMKEASITSECKTRIATVVLASAPSASK